LVIFWAFLALYCFCPSEALLGVDISTCSTITLAELECMVNDGYTFIALQAWQGGNGMVSNIASCVSMAYQAGFTYVDVYVYLCPECAGQNPPTSMANTLSALGLKVNYYWLDVEPCSSGCWTDATNNVAYLQSAIAAFEADGLKVGIYSSEGSWDVMGGSTAFSSVPLWYAHYDGVAAYSDESPYAMFGGWTSTPIFKQYAGSTSLCSASVDLDYTPSLPTPPPPATLPSGCVAVLMVNSAGVNFRSGASTTATVIATLGEGTTVYEMSTTTTSADGYTWEYVQYNGQNGYMADTYLTKVSDCPTMPHTSAVTTAPKATTLQVTTLQVTTPQASKVATTPHTNITPTPVLVSPLSINTISLFFGLVMIALVL